MKQLILVVDDNVTSRDALRTCLQSSGFDVAVLYEPGKLMARVEVERPALIIITSGPSFGSGLAALQTLRGRGDDCRSSCSAKEARSRNASWRSNVGLTILSPSHSMFRK